MIHWHFTGMVLEPDSVYDQNGAYSGSSVVYEEKLHLFYTGNVKEEGNHDYILSGRQANVLSVSTVDGHHMSPKSILLKNSDYPKDCSCHVRDPKVWLEDGVWHMVLGARTRESQGCVLYYESADLKTWTYKKRLTVQDFGYMWECPDEFVIDDRRYLSISPQGLSHKEYCHQNVYSSGYFMVEEQLTDFEEWDYGFDFYAPQTFESDDGRRILYGWMGLPDCPYENPTVELGWQHCLTLPRVVTANASGHLLQNPVEEINQLRYDKWEVCAGETVNVSLPFDLTADTDGPFCICLNQDICMNYENGIFTLEFKNEKIGRGRSVRRVKLEICRKLRIIADYSSMEIYLDGGRKVLSTRFYPEKKEVTLDTNIARTILYKMKPMSVE
ncbi:MAG: glycoside hydrolase family 32 protein, partial [Lachnospiraceae bacterium]|nr:glycoside hydrolase family 32 protein [Lachnospiraceae bacterium]